MYKSLFLDAQNDDKKIILDYFNLLNGYILKKTDPHYPYIQGKFPKQLNSFLNEKELNFDKQSPEDVLFEMAEYFRGTTRWHHPFVMNNIKTPINLPAAAVAFNTMLLDPNIANDTNCGQIAFAELEVIKYMSTLIGWNYKNSGGYFTFGGTSTILNAIKAGIHKAKQDVCENGINGDNLFVVSSQQGHSAHADACNWLGLGRKNCIRVSVDDNYQIDIAEAEKRIVERIEQGGKLAAIIGCGGTTIQMIVDPIDQLYELRERIVSRFKLSYKPHIHVDSVVGWVWLFFKNYDYELNPMKLTDVTLNKIKNMERLISKCDYADSVGIDFHKTGFCPYASSLFLTKSKQDTFDLNEKPVQSIDQIEYGEYSPSTYTLELSRSAIGPLTALTTLKLLGVCGFRNLLGDIVEGANQLIKGLDRLSGFEVINTNTNGTCILYIIKPADLMDISYSELHKKSIEDVKRLALYNYRFYLFVLKKINEKQIDFFVDYSSGYEKVKNGFHMGVLKMQTFNPMLTYEKISDLLTKIVSLKEQYDQYQGDFQFETQYKPKKPKLTHNNEKIILL